MEIPSADGPLVGPTLLMKPKCTEPYFPKAVLPFEKRCHTLCR